MYYIFIYIIYIKKIYYIYYNNDIIYYIIKYSNINKYNMTDSIFVWLGFVETTFTVGEESVKN